MRYLIHGMLLGMFAALAAAPPSLPLEGALSRTEARAIALINHPDISVAELREMAARQVNLQARSAYFPTVTANTTAAGTTQDNTRLAAGAINNPSVYERVAEGVSVTQLITDFGRTANLAAASMLRANAEATNAAATRAQIEMLVDTSYFSALEAQAVLRVATQTVATRMIILDQVRAYASNHLKSDLDVGFADVGLGEAQLLLARAKGEFDASMEQLNTQLGLRERPQFVLVDEPLPPALDTGVETLVAEALQRRPDLARVRLERMAALKFSRAEKALRYPTVTAIGGAGLIPVHGDAFESSYAAAAVNISLPIFNGGLFAARNREAELRAQAVEEGLRRDENVVIRDVRISWTRVGSAWERFGIATKLLDQASKTLDLTEARYQAGSASIVELSQSQLNKTSAEISLENAKYDYLIQRAILEFQTGGDR